MLIKWEQVIEVNIFNIFSINVGFSIYHLFPQMNEINYLIYGIYISLKNI